MDGKPPAKQKCVKNFIQSTKLRKMVNMTHNSHGEREADTRMEESQQGPEVLGRDRSGGRGKNGHGQKHYAVCTQGANEREIANVT